MSKFEFGFMAALGILFAAVIVIGGIAMIIEIIKEGGEALLILGVLSAILAIGCIGGVISVAFS